MRIPFRNWLDGDPQTLALHASGGMAERIENGLVRPLSGRSASWLAAGRLLFPTMLVALATGAAHRFGQSIAPLLFGAELLLAIGLAYFLALRGELFWPTRREAQNVVIAGAIACAPLLLAPMLDTATGLLAALLPIAAIWLAPICSGRLNSPQAAFAALCSVLIFVAPMACWHTWPAILSGSFDLAALALGAALALAYGLTCRDAETHVAA